MLKIHYYDGFTSRLLSWDLELIGKAATVDAEWSRGSPRTRIAKQVSNESLPWAEWKSELVQLIPVGETRVGDADDIGGYTIVLEHKGKFRKWIETGSLGATDKIHAEVRKRMKKIIREVHELLDPK